MEPAALLSKLAASAHERDVADLVASFEATADGPLVAAATFSSACAVAVAIAALEGVHRCAAKLSLTMSHSAAERSRAAPPAGARMRLRAIELLSWSLDLERDCPPLELLL